MDHHTAFRPVAPHGSVARRSLPLLLCLLLIAGQASAVSPAAQVSNPGSGTRATTAPKVNGPAPIADGLLARLGEDGAGRFVVEFSAEADLGAAARVRGHAARGQAVVDRLRATADAAQAEVRALVRRNEGARFEGFWLRNVAIVTGSASIAERIAEMPGVEEVREERAMPLVVPVATEAATGDERPWGLDAIGAPAAWERGVVGSGVVVANIDSGVDFAHPALADSYRGNVRGAGFDHDYAWWDPTGICGSTPCDNTGHGTHTMGTMVGGDGPGPFTPDIGVAPGATWIAAKGCEEQTCSEAALLSSGQWVMAPTRVDGSDPDPARRPDVVNNSWSGVPGDPFYEDVVASWQAAGIIPIFSAGNSGPGCNTVGAPGDSPLAIAVGATDEADGIAEFSSRGPSVHQVTKPDLVAPGVTVVSAAPGGGYQAGSGTSMAAPHVAGAVALVLSASGAETAAFEELRSVLTTTAVELSDGTCGSGDGANNVYGEGRLDAAAAVGLVAGGATLIGTVSGPAGPLSGARVTVEGPRVYTVTTDAQGGYRLLLPPGTYAVSADAFAHLPARIDTVSLSAGETITADLALEAMPTATVSGVVAAVEDGAPLGGVRVRPVGVPVNGATTDADGRYALELPLGSYLLLVTAGGCTEPIYVSVDLLEDATHDVTVVRRLDRAGHGCRQIESDWVEAQLQTALIGDNWAGRLRMPFDFPFYGQDFADVFVNPNGFVNFLEADPFHDQPGAIPDRDAPNGAIYWMWRNMQITEAGSINYDVVGEAPDRAFVLEFQNVSVNDHPGFLDAELKLWENGAIDLLYGGSRDGLADGSSAVIGIENADGDDALALATFEPVIEQNTAYRIDLVPTGLVSGVVTAANDGLPIQGARISASPGGQTAVSDGDGRYTLRLLPGAYDLSVEALGYAPTSAEVTVALGEEHVRDFVLASPIASVAPSTIDAMADLGTPVTATLTVHNDGSGPLAVDVREADGGVTLPELPPAGTVDWVGGWDAAASAVPEAPVESDSVPPEALLPIVDDPAGDMIGTVDITAVRGAGDADEITFEVDLGDEAQAASAFGFVYLDVDQDPLTGFPPSIHNGLPTQDIGADLYVELWQYSPPVLGGHLINPFTGESWRIPVRVEGATIGFDLPRAALADDGWMDVAMVMGDAFGASDWAPEVGHGSVETYAEASWLSIEPATASVPPGESLDLTVTLGGPGVVAGDYVGEIVLLTDDLASPRIRVPVTLEMGLPDDFGRIEGRVTDAHTGAGLPAVITVDSASGGAPHEASTTADEDGNYVLFAPAGEWTAEVSHAGYVTAATSVTVTAGTTRDGVDVSLHEVHPHATVTSEPIVVQMLAGETRTVSIDIGNAEGHASLEVDVHERPIADADPEEPPAFPEGETDAAPDGWSPAEVEASVEGNPVLVVMSHLPWDSDALLQVLAANDLGHDVVGPDQLGVLDLAAYRVVIVASDQTQPFYDALAGEMDHLERFVRHGGFLWFSAGAWGFAGGSLDGATLPGGVTVEGPVFEFTNAVREPDHPVVQGIPSPVFGEFASAAAFGELPDDSQVIMTGESTSKPTLVEYNHGAGRVLASTQPLEYAWTFGWELGLLLDNGVPYVAGFEAFGDVSWLSLDPTQATVGQGETVTLDVTLDTSGLNSGRYRADVVVVTDDPELPAAVVPITLVVPAYQQGVNAGGGEITGIDGTVYAADRRYEPGASGYDGASSTRRLKDPIAGTEDDARFADLRTGMAAYRFDVPNGMYTVTLDFAELSVRRTGGRVFNVDIEGETILANLDLVAEAGFATALSHTVEVSVTDGRLDVEFSAVRGDKPIVNAISVTHMP